MIKSGTPVHFENYGAGLKKYYDAYTWKIAENQVAVILTDITERKNAEEALKISEQRWSTTLSSIGDAMIATDTVGRITFMNAVAEQLTGWKLSDAQQKPIAQVFKTVNEKTRQTVENPVFKVLVKGLIVGLGNHTVLIRKDGPEVPIDESGAPIRTEDCKTTGAVLVFRDITERKKSEQALWQAKNDWERTFDTIPDFIAILDNNHKIVRANRAMAEQLGVKPEQAIGLSCYKCVHGTELPPEFCPHAKTLEDGEEHVAEVHEPRLGGDFIVSTTPIKDEQGRVTGSVHVARNITERKKTEREIERLASFPTLNPNPVFEVDFNGKITYSNPTTRILFPDLEDLCLTHPFLSDWSNIVKNFAHKTVIFFGREIKVGDHWYHEQMYYVPQTHKIRVYTVDVDELKKTEEARAKAQIKLEENAILLEEYASQMEELAEQRAQQLKNSERLAAIGQTAGMVGHDIRNPLQAITGDMYLIKQELESMPEGENKQAVFESIDAVNENLTYIDKIVSDLQDYTRPL